MSDNNFLKSFGTRVEQLNFRLEESILRGSFDTELNLNEVLQLFRGTIAEIKNLQLQVDSLKEALRNK